jgi:perosamine synthetase
MVDLGYNYRITDFQCALGVSQLNKLPKWLARRQEIARMYDAAFEAFPYVKPLSVSKDVLHAYHLYVVRIMDTEPSKNRKAVFKRLREKGIGANVHYLPVHLHPFYKKRFHTDAGLCPVAEQAYDHILSLPMFPKLKSHEQEYVIKTIKDIWS